MLQMSGQETYNASSDTPLAQSLTPREEEILNCLGTGMSNRQIAGHLTVSINTVKWYVRQVYNKLGVNNRAEAVARARDLGLMPQEDGATRNNLPVSATPFVGRERELTALAEFIAGPHVRLITITGPGGIGKTRLALEGASRELQSSSQFRDGIFFVSLAPLETAEEIVATLAAVLAFQFQGTGNESAQLLNYLQNKQMLLVMDNFDHILDGRALLAEINELAAGITLIVTSRERLQMRGEQIFPLGGLETAHAGNPAKVSPAAELFLNIARRTSPSFQLLERDAAQVIRICQLVEGMPLGLELAASWAGLLPLSEIAAGLEQSLGLLTTEHHDVPQRHQSMEAALDVSWRKLTSKQQRALQELAMFRGGFTRATALEIAGATLPLLVTLANKSWLSYDRQKDRYHIHELLRQYGAGKLGVDPAHEKETQARHSAYFCGYLQEREADWHGPRQTAVASEVRDEIDNIQRAWRWAADKGDVILLAQGLVSLCRFYFWEGRMNNGHRACQLALESLSKSPVARRADEAQYLSLRARILVWESYFVREVEQKEALLSQSQQLLDRAKQSSQHTEAEQALIFLGKAYAAEHTDVEEAICLGNLGLELFRKLDDRANEAEVLALLGFFHLIQGNSKLAKDLSQKSLEIREQLNDMMGIARAKSVLGAIARFVGHFEESESLTWRSLTVFQQLAEPRGVKRCLGSLSYTHNWAGDFVAAKKTAEQASTIDRDLGQYPNPWRLNPLAQAMIHLGSFSEAHDAAAESLDLAIQEGLLFEKGWALMFLGSLSIVEGNAANAKPYLLTSVAVLAELRHTYQSVSQAILSYVARAEGDYESARDNLASALRSGIGSRSISPLMYCLPIAGLLAADDEDQIRAIELYSLARQFGHIRNSRWFEVVACNELDEVHASMPEEKAAAAEARGRELDVWETAEALLRELEKSSRSTL